MAAGEGFGSSLSAKEKADLLKLHRASSKQANYDLKPGYVPTDADFRFQKTGIRGHRKYLFYLIVAILFVIALGNLLTTFVLLGVLRLGYGTESFEFFPPGRLLRFLTPSHLDHVISLDGNIGGFSNENLHIVSNEQPIILNVGHGIPTTMELSLDGTTFRQVDQFKVVNPRTGKDIFSTDYYKFGLPDVVKNLKVNQVHVARITSPTDKSMMINSSSQILLRGNEAFRMAGREIVMVAEEDIVLKSVNANVILDGKQGVILAMDRMPEATGLRLNEGRAQYKICVCAEGGRIFWIPLSKNLDYTCANAVVSGTINPCNQK